MARPVVNRADLDAGKETPRVRVKGWVYDPDLTKNPWVRIMVDGKIFRPAQPTNVRRPNLASTLQHGNDLIGFDRQIRLSRGKHKICIEVNNRDGLDPVQITCRTLVV